jgi:hypothetical protein
MQRPLEPNLHGGTVHHEKSSARRPRARVFSWDLGLVAGMHYFDGISRSAGRGPHLDLHG